MKWKLPDIDLGTLAKTAKATFVAHRPEILTGLGIVGFATTVGLVMNATPKALTILDEAYAEQNEGKPQPAIEDLPKAMGVKETVKLTWKCYIPAAITGVLSTACIIGGATENNRRNAALAAAYSLSEKALEEYKEQVTKVVGEKKEQLIQGEVAQSRIDKDPVSNKEVIFTGHGDVLCYDSVSGRYFKSSADKIRKVENALNRQMRDDMYISLNEFYTEIGLEPVGIGEKLGWNVDRGEIDIRFDARVGENDEPCLVLDYRIQPDYDYGRIL